MQTKYHSYKIGNLPKGCQLCVQGRKMVMFITGLCANHCYYCPISDKKKNKDVIYANEWKTRDKKDILEEIQLCESKGAGITGGDPLKKLSRVIEYIKIFKKKFGTNFHIHLYTPLNLVDEKKLEQLHKAGLDEIRFHPSLDSKKYWSRIELAQKFKWDVGVEIPAIPGKEKIIKQLIDYIKDKIKFLNLNELEISDTNAQSLVDKGFKPKNKISYGVRGSETLAMKLLKYSKGKIKNVHYCTTILKDRVQLSKRIKLRAKNVQKDYDLVTKEGMLFRGAIYTRKPKQIAKQLMKEYQIPKKFIETEKKRILLASWILNELKEELKKKKLKIAFIEEYPTQDKLEVYVNYL